MAAKSMKSLGLPCASNVIDLVAYRARRRQLPMMTVYYLTQHRRGLPPLEAMGLRIIEIQSEDQLVEAQGHNPPNLFILDSTIEWAPLMPLIERLQEQMGIPMILLCDRTFTEDRSQLKAAYARGICDTLTLPPEKNELEQALNVLLKLSERASTYQ